MGDIKIRNLDQYTISKIDSLAAGQNLSREEYLRRQLKSLAITAEIKEVEDRYERLVLDITDVMQGFSEKVAELTNKIEGS